MSLSPSDPPTGTKLEPGAHLDRYELLAEIARGGMATVWLGRMKGKRGFERLVAIKTIRPEYTEDERFEEMFLDEARIASGIHHPNVAQIIDLGEQDETLYLVMEYVDGESLARLRRSVARKGVMFPVAISLRIVADACAGLHAAHELKEENGVNLQVVHRDVSPQNILVTTAGAVKVIDFGIAKARNRLAGETSVGLFKGKAPYMAPEQAMGQTLDRRVDIWAIGVVLYELLTGKLPFEGESQIEQLRLVTSGSPPPPLSADIPDDIHDIIRQSLAHTPAGRFSTAVAMQRAIETALAKIAPTTSDDVAAFVNQHLRERMTQKKALVQEALADAAAREGRGMTTQEMVAAGLPNPKMVPLAKHPDETPSALAPEDDDNAPTRKKEYVVPVSTRPSLIEVGSVEPSSYVSESPLKKRKRGPMLFALSLILIAGVGVAIAKLSAKEEKGGAGESSAAEPPRSAEKDVSSKSSRPVTSPEPATSESTKPAASLTTAPSASPSNSKKPVRPPVVGPGPATAAPPVKPGGKCGPDGLDC